MNYQNPVISGCYPDPSICRVGDTYYLVCSSFQYFPGVPLFESRDLVNWTQIGHVLTRPSQLPLQNANSVGGIYAPTIRYDNGRFYMVTTNVTNGGHFYVWTDDIYGEWSDPVYVDQEGIDPSLFFEDGKAYFMSNGSDADGHSAVLQCEIDITTGKRISETKAIWGGAGGRFLESPHLYHIGNYYYLMAAEGGTEYGHMVIYARGNSPYGPFAAYPHNPVLTNRNLGGYLLQGAGHADLVDDPQGNWWMVHLGFRQIHQWVMHHITGREVCLVPVTFDADGWFTAGVDGTSRLEMETDRIPASVVQQKQTAFTFADANAWVFLQNPHGLNYSCSEHRFILQGTQTPLSSEEDSPTWLGMRQKEAAFRLSVDMSLAPQEAGVTVYMTGTQHYDLFVAQRQNARCLVRRAQLGALVHEETVPLPDAPDGSENITLTVQGDAMNYRFSAQYGDKPIDMGALETKYLSTETAGNFTGVMLALYAYNPAPENAAQTVFRDFRLTYPQA